MKLVYFRGDRPNFGDELSPLLWNSLLPSGFLDEDSNELFLGIGSILWDHLPPAPLKHVVGSGYGGYSGAPNVHDGSWNVLFVRGPHTAQRLGLPPEKAICDAAALLRLTSLPEPTPGIDVAFMPHCASLGRGFWEDVCTLANITLIDPRGDPLNIVSRIRGAKVLIAEAMHGAIVADTVRVPWIAAQPLHTANRMKWSDWAASLSVELRWHRLRPSSVMEAYHARTVLAEPWRAQKTRESPIFAPFNRILVHAAARRLSKIAQAEPQMSDDGLLQLVVDRAAAVTDKFIQSRAGSGLRSNPHLLSLSDVPSFSAYSRRNWR